MQRDGLFYLAGYAVRSALAVAAPGFPQLRCVESACLLQYLLHQHGFPARVMRGVFRLDKPLPNAADDPKEGLTLAYSHDWVEVDDTVIDLSGDQFDSGLHHPWAPVYVGPRGDRYVDGGDVDSSSVLDDPVCQAVLFELSRLFPGWSPGEGPEGGLGPIDFTWWSTRNPVDQAAFKARLENLGRRVQALLNDMPLREIGKIPSDKDNAWITWAPSRFGDNVAYRHRPHITLDVTPRELVLHLNLELAECADHFSALVKTDSKRVLETVCRLGCNLELHVYQRRHIVAMKWNPERPVFYSACDLIPEQLVEAVQLAEEWGKQEGTRQAYLVSQRIPAARVIALGSALPAELARRIQRLGPGLDFFDWKKRG